MVVSGSGWRFFVCAPVAALAAFVALSGAANAATAQCTAFKAAFLKSTSDLKIEFVRPVVVSRGERSNDEVFDIVSDTKVDGTLRCQGERIVRFEARITVPTDSKVMERFERLGVASIANALKWTNDRAQTAWKTLTAEASEYLFASIQRGDVAIAGKTEYHEGGADLGMMWTPTDRMLVIVGD